MSFLPGTRLGAYEITSLLGAGGMGEVYRATDTRLHRTVAIKVLSTALGADPRHLQRFAQEAEATGRVNHPNIVVVYDIGTHEGVPFIVSELLEGETLRERLRRGSISPATAVQWAVDVLHGLTAAHERGIVHRDLKPENLFITTDSRIKILDFGLARLTEEPWGTQSSGELATALVTRAGTILGTPGYMAPEQLQGLPTDARADVFALGAVLYEMLTGSRAFKGDTAIDAMHATLRSDPAPLPTNLETTQATLGRVIRRAMAKEPSDRFQSARDFGFALSELTRSGSTFSESGQRAAPRFRQSRRAVIVVAAVVVAAVASGLLLGRLGPSPAVDAFPTIRSLAVLPLRNLSRDPDQEFFSEGMTAALITDLAKIGSLRVISRTSVMRYIGTNKSLPDIARELNVDAIVEGSVLRAGQDVRIDAQLVVGSTDHNIWAKSYQRPLKDVLQLQSEIAATIASEIRTTLTPEDARRLAAARPVNAAAHDAYLKGRYELDKGDREHLTRALALFNEAIAIDPAFALPYAGIADTYSLLRSVYLPPHEVMPKARTAAFKAIELDPELAEAHVSLGSIKLFYEYDWQGAEHEMKRAIELKPGLAEAHDGYAAVLAGTGRLNEAIAAEARARDLDPLSAQYAGNAAWNLYLARRYTDAVQQAKAAVALNPDLWFAHTMLGLAYEKSGRYQDAIESLNRAKALDRSPTILEFLAGAYVAAGRTTAARQILAELTKRASEEYVCPYEIATVHATLGDTKAALAELEKGYEDRADCMPWVEADPKLDSLRQLPQFQDMRRRMGLTQ